MRSIPVDQNRTGVFIALSVRPDADQEGTQKTNFENLPIWKVECLNRPAARPDGSTPKADVMDVKIASHSEPQVSPMNAILFDDLQARPWNMNGSSGVSFSALGLIEDN